MNILKGKYFYIVLFLLVYKVNDACINEIGTSIFEEKTRIHDKFNFVMKFNLRDSLERLQDKEKKLKIQFEGKKKNNEYYNDLAEIRIYQGKYKEAIQLLKSCKSPTKDEQYSINSNLGVAYELLGNLDSAYFFTKKALSLNKGAHENSELIHLKILEATILSLKDKNYLYSNYFIGGKIIQKGLPGKNIADFKQSDSNPDTADSRGWSAMNYIMRMEYQLEERLIFVKPQNTAVANMLFTLADLYITEVDFQKANEIYALVIKYDSAFTPLCNGCTTNIPLCSIFHHEVFNSVPGITFISHSKLGHLLQSIHCPPLT